MMAVVSSDCMYVCLFSVNYFNHQQSSLIDLCCGVTRYCQLPDLLWIFN